MNVIYKDHTKDERVNCYSVIAKVSVQDYMDFINKVYLNKGGIEGQRSPLKTKSAQRIRKRLVADIQRKAVIPPIVIGISLTNEQYESFERDIPQGLNLVLSEVTADEQVSIIDGMQRTTAIFEALAEMEEIRNHEIRLEFWIAKSTNSLIYRMLVLNTGQIPWNLKRQLEVVFAQLKKELESNVNGLKLFTSDDRETRNNPGEYQASHFIELFMLFGTKRISTDIHEELAEEFAKLDIIETSGNVEFMDIFYSVSTILVNIDAVFSKVTANNTDMELSKFKIGKDIFTSQPARAGFIVAFSQEIFGLPGVEYSYEEQTRRTEVIKNKFTQLIAYINGLDLNRLSEFIDLPTLDEKISLSSKSGKVGEFERNYFLKSFKTLIDIVKTDTLHSLTPCWSTTY